MDLLGYIEMIKRAAREQRSQALLTSLYGPLKNAREWLEDAYLEFIGESPQKDEFALRAFTDNIVIGWPLQTSTPSSTGSALYRALKKVSSFQLDMATRGFFVRGAVSVGEVFIDDIAVFGPALLDAYEAEQERADTPRVILTSSAVEAERRYRATYPSSESYALSRFIRTDADDERFISYLDADFLDDVVIAQHRDAVEAKLNQFKGDTRICHKYRWVAEYHNSFCVQHTERFGQHQIRTS